jgi:hypothetical protein
MIFDKVHHLFQIRIRIHNLKLRIRIHNTGNNVAGPEPESGALY